MLYSIDLPPGLYKNGTDLQSTGRYSDGNLVRFFEGTVRPVGGWISWASSTVTGKPRCCLAWLDNSSGRWLGVGTHSGLYVYNESGSMFNITPVGFTTGRADAVIRTGYGYGPYGAYAYGVARPDTGIYLDATMWTMDTWGQYLVGCSVSDGVLYQWQLGTGTPAAAITNAPTGCRALVVTQERILMALGSGSNPRKVQWSDQEDNTVWTPSATNQAGDFELQTSGKLMCGKRVRDTMLLLTDVDAHVAIYQGAPAIYGFNRVGTGCGIISQQGVAVIDTQAAWMGRAGFYLYDGTVNPLDCDVYDKVFSDINIAQGSKVCAVHNSIYGEIWWFYPSSAATENDRYVSWNYREGHWAFGAFERTCGTDKGVFTKPLMVNASGSVYQHETALAYDGASPYLESGPFQIADGGQIVTATQLIPDDNTLGDVTATFKTKMYPDGAETTSAAYTLSASTDLRLTARQLKVRYTTATTSDWRIGKPRLEYATGGSRR